MHKARDLLMNFLSNDLGVDTVSIETSAPLVSSGIIDSLALISLLTFIETQLKRTVRPEDVTLENLDSVDRIMSFLQRGAL
jgi:acyl carrier protein